MLAWGSESLDLLLTARADSAGYKVFGSPSFAGGPDTKAGQLKNGAAKTGELYSTLICLSAVRVPLFVLWLLRRRGVKIHVNQNGVYYPLWYPAGFRRKNAYLLALSRSADHVFFQSEFARRAFLKWVGPLPASQSLLYNAVDRAKFSPNEARRTDPSRLRILVFQDFREINRELWEFQLSLVNRVPGAQWVFMGRRESVALEETVREGMAGCAVEWVLSPGNDEVAKVLPSCDVALHFVPNDVCPNKVLECLASGVYVICSGSGGSPELVAGGGGEALPAREDFDARHFPDAELVLAALERFRAHADGKRREAGIAAQKFGLAQWIKAMTGSPR